MPRRNLPLATRLPLLGAGLAIVVLSLSHHPEALASSQAVRDLHDRAKEALKAGNHSLAIDLEKQAVTLDPNDPLPRKGLCCIYQELGRLDDALKEARQAVALAPGDANAHYNLASTLQRQKNFSEALDHYTEAVKLEPSDVGAHIGQAQCLLASGRISEAIDVLEPLSRKYPKDVDVLLNLSDVYLTARDGAGALQAAEKARSLEPNSYRTTYSLAEVHRRLHNYQTAQNLGWKLINMEPRDPQGYILLSTLFMEEVRGPELCAPVVEAARKNLSDSADLFLFLGMKYRERAEYYSTAVLTRFPRSRRLAEQWLKLSEDCLRQSVKADPDRFSAHLELGKTLSRQRKTHEALAHVRRARTLNPEHQETREVEQSFAPVKNDVAGNLKYHLQKWLWGDSST